MDLPRESIFRATLRTFFSSFAAMVGILLGLAVVVIAIIALSGPTMIPEKTEFTVAPDANGKTELLPMTTPVVLRIDIHGPIGELLLNSETFGNILADSREDMLKDNRVKAILLHVNTPGGVVTDLDDMHRALKAYKEKYKVPVYAFVDGLCASGGVYISVTADRIYATPSSVIGSVGVIMGPAFNFSGAMEKLGVQSLTLTEGKDKDFLNPFRPWRPDEDASLRAITGSLYQRFVAIVTEGRPMMNKEKLINEYGAHVFIAEKAKELGYIDDADADYSKALTELVQAAGLGDKPYQVVTLHPKMNFFSYLAQGKLPFFSGKVKHVFQIGPNLSSEMSGKFLYLYQPLSQ